MEHHEEHFAFLKPSGNSKRLYVHIPFCSGHCTFCNYKIIVGAEEHWTYLNYIVRRSSSLKATLASYRSIMSYSAVARHRC